MAKTEERPEGRTRWGRMSAVALPATGALAGMAYAMVQGALAATVTIAGVPTQVVSELANTSAVSLQANVLSDDATTAKQYGTALAGINTATLNGLCANVQPNIGGVAMSVNINAGGYTGGGSGGYANQLSLSNGVINASALTGGTSTVSNTTLGIAGSKDANAVNTLGAQAAGTWDTAVGSASVPQLNANLQDAVLSGSLTLPALKVNAALGTGLTCAAP